MRPELRHAARSGPAPAVDIRDYLESPLRRPWLVIVPTLLGVAVAIAAIMVVPKRYASTTLILVEAEKAPAAIVNPGAAISSGRRLETLKQEVLSRTRLERVIQELAPYPERRNEPLTVTVEMMRRAVDIDVKGNDAFTIQYTHGDPEKARQVTDRLVALFIEETSASRESQVEQATSFLETQVQQAAKELESQEQAVQRYKQAHLGSLPEQLQSNLATLQRLQLEQETIAQSLRAAQDRTALLEAQPAAGRSAAPADLAALRDQLEALRGRYTDEHPDVVALRARVQRLERAAAAPAEPSSRGLQEAQAEVRSLQDRRVDLVRRMAEIQVRVEAAPRGEQDLATLSRDLTKLKENYLGLLNKKLEAQMVEKLEKRWKGERFKVLDPASLPDRPIYPSRRLFLAGGLVLGAGLGLLLCVGAETLDHSIKHLGDLQAALPYPLVASVGHIDLPGSRRFLFWRRLEGTS